MKKKLKKVHRYQPDTLYNTSGFTINTPMANYDSKSTFALQNKFLNNYYKTTL